MKLPPQKKLIKSKWVFKVKKDSDCNAVKYKARLVARGFTQRYGVDYEGTFSPVVRSDTLRLLLALPVNSNPISCIDHLDVNSAFLNSEIIEEICMEQPENYVVKGFESYVCELKKALNGLKTKLECLVWKT